MERFDWRDETIYTLTNEDMMVARMTPSRLHKKAMAAANAERKAEEKEARRKKAN